MPASLPASNGIPDGPWSGVPLWRGLDSAFLCAPAIPKAPGTPRVRIEIVGRSLRISDDDLKTGFALGGIADDSESLRKYLAPPMKLLLLFGTVGFLGGIALALLFGVLG